MPLPVYENKGGKMNNKDYKFEQLWKDLDTGYQIYFTYMDVRYLLVKLKKNCYSKEVIQSKDKSPHPKMQIVTLKTVSELFPYMENIEYKV